MFDRLLPELISLISEYLSHTDYLAAAQSNKHWWTHLTCIGALRRHLREEDVHLTHHDLLHGLFMLSKHLLLIEQKVPCKMGHGTEKRMMPFTTYSTPLYLDMGLDLYHQAHYAGAENQRETSIIKRSISLSYTSPKELLLYRNGDIRVDLALYRVQACAIIQWFGRRIVYRGKDRYYYVLDFESGVRQLDVPDAAHIQSLQCVFRINPPYQYLTIRHILYDNGDLHEAEIEYFVDWKTPTRQHQLIRRNVRDVMWMGFDHWILTFAGELHYIAQGEVQYSYLEVPVQSISLYRGMFGDNLCFLTSIGEVYRVDMIGKNIYHRLLYKSNESFRALKVFDTFEHEMVIRLLR